MLLIIKVPLDQPSTSRYYAKVDLRYAVRTFSVKIIIVQYLCIINDIDVGHHTDICKYATFLLKFLNAKQPRSFSEIAIFCTQNTYTMYRYFPSGFSKVCRNILNFTNLYETLRNVTNLCKAMVIINSSFQHFLICTKSPKFNAQLYNIYR